MNNHYNHYYVGKTVMRGMAPRKEICVVRVDGDGDRHFVRDVNHEVRHSPTGLEWGYTGSGPADTALSILMDFLVYEEDMSYPLARQIADEYYQQFKFDVVAGLNGPGFALPFQKVKQWLGKAVEQEYTYA